MENKKISQAYRNYEDGTYDVTMADGTLESFLTFRGSVVWPQIPYPGIVLLAGEKRVQYVPKIDSVILCEARDFTTNNEAAAVFLDIWSRYHPEGYFHHYISNNGFIDNVYETEGLQDKVTFFPLIEPEKSDNVNFGLTLIKDYLQADNKLLFQKEGTEALSTHLKNFSIDDESQRYKITALRYLITGIHGSPWMPSYYDEDDDFGNEIGRSEITGY